MRVEYDIDNLINGDREAFRQFVHHHQKDVYRLAFRFLSAQQDAEDITQEVFIDAFKSLSSFRKESSLSTWLYRITVNRSLNFVKKNRKYIETRSLDFRSDETDHKFKIDLAADYSYDPSVRIERAEKRELINRAISSLSENQKTAFVLHKLEGMPYAQVADIMNLSLSAVESHIHRAKLALQKKLLGLNKEIFQSKQVLSSNNVQQ